MWGFMCRRRGFLYPVFVMCGMAAFLDVPKKKVETADSVVFYRCSTYFPFGLLRDLINTHVSLLVPTS